MSSFFYAMIKRADKISDIQSYYFARKLEEISQMNIEGKDVINLGIGSPDQPAPKEVIQKLTSVMQDQDLHKYQPYRGLPELRTAFADWYDQIYSVAIHGENEVLPLMGSKEGIMHISMAFLNPEDEVLVPNPGYPAYTSISKICGANVRSYDLTEENDFQIDLASLEKQDLTKVKIMWINYPHMPTGAVAKAEIFERLVELAKRNNFILTHDNPYACILNDNPLSLFQFDPYKKVSLELCSLSKHYNMAGWRIGAVIGNPTYIDSILTFKSNMDSGMFKGLQLAAIEALRLDQIWFTNLNKLYTQRKALILKLFDVLNCTYGHDTAGLFVWAKIPSGVKSGESYADRILHENQVFITPGFIFGKNGDRYIRASLCQPDSIIKKAIARCR